MGAFVKTIAEFYKQGIEINTEIGFILSVLLIYKAFYYVLGMFFTRKFKPAKTKHKYGICIAARNEESVIGNLLDSINKQDYPKDLFKVFVVADNCTDNTYKVAKEKGAVVYKRFDDKHRTKGFALQFLFEQIEKDYKRSSFDGFFIFDADNLLKEDYISRMNDAFDSGEKIITSFRNTKNFDENWIASNYALHWIRSARTNHRARSILRLATNIQGTGFLFASEIVRNGWKYTSLTEDRALTADCVAAGYRISYQDAAEFYDEQPVSLKIALRQRLRWSKGHLQAFVESGPYLFINILFGKLIVKKDWRDLRQKEERNIAYKFLESIRHRFASFDTLIQLTPIVFINLLRWFILYVLIYGCYAYIHGGNKYLFGGGNEFATMLREYCDIRWKMPPGLKTMFICMAFAVLYRLIYRIGEYTKNMMDAVYFFIVEYARIKKMSIFKKVLYVITWPIFDIIGRYTIYIALFTKVTWKPIPHNSKVTIDDLKRE